METMYYIKTLATLTLALAAFTAQAGQTSYFIYDESGHVIGEYDANGNPIQEHIYLGDKPVAVVTNSHVDTVITDQLNTPRIITDSSQAVVWALNSDPFGNGQPTGALTYNLRFPGQYYDAETGHNYNYFRDYDASTGRYTESDRLGIIGSINTYLYTDANPLNSGDPRGTAPQGASPYYYTPNPLGQPPQPYDLGWTICDGDGRILPYVVDERCLKDCTYAHEMVHVADLYHAGHGACINKPYGTIIAFSDSSADVASEIKAYNSEKTCLQTELKHKYCKDNVCQGVINQKLREINNADLPNLMKGLAPAGN